MLSRTGEYALRAMVCLAQHVDEWPVPGRVIAERTGIPAKYLSSILGDLVRVGLLESSPGVGGGFRMVRPARQIRLREVLGPFEPILGPSRPCPFGNEVCNDEAPCAGHDRWLRVKELYSDFLSETSVHDVSIRQNGAKSSASGKRRKK